MEKSPCVRFHYVDNEGNIVFKKKIAYAKKETALKKAHEMSNKPNAIHQFSVYLCPKCHKWHIGKSSVETINKNAYNN